MLQVTERFHSKGFTVIESVKLSGRVLDQYEDAIEDANEGDIWIRPQLDAVGRLAVSGRHANWGYSGYVVVSLHADGARRKFLGSQDLYPLGENRYASQSERGRAETEVTSRIAALKGEEIVKVKGGWRLVDIASSISRMHSELIAASEKRVDMVKPLGLQGAAMNAADPEARRKFTEMLKRKTVRRVPD